MSDPSDVSIESSSQFAHEDLVWTYDRAFVRNRGIIGEHEQETLRNSRVAIAGMGGIGGIDLVTLARLGIGRFTIADPDVFEPANINRQFGAMCSTLGRSKAQVMADIVRDINPEADIRVFSEPIGADNGVDFLQEADVFVDAIEVFETEARRLLFRLAHSQGIYGITAGPVGFSGVWMSFDPQGMTFDDYFDFREGMDSLEKLVAFGVGVTPKATQRSYMDFRKVDVANRVASSTSLACQLAAGAMACEVVKILLKRGKVKSAPWYHQFDPFVGRYARGYCCFGNRHPWQRFKRFWLARALRSKLS